MVLGNGRVSPEGCFLVQGHIIHQVPDTMGLVSCAIFMQYFYIIFFFFVLNCFPITRLIDFNVLQNGKSLRMTSVFENTTKPIGMVCGSLHEYGDPLREKQRMSNQGLSTE